MTDVNRIKQVLMAMEADKAGQQQLDEVLPTNAFRHHGTKFRAKLTEDERLAIIALYRKGIKRGILAMAFGIDVRTVSNLCNSHSLKYKSTREKAMGYSLDDLARMYITEDIALKVAEAAAKEAANMESFESTRGPSQRANKRAGIHRINLPHLSYEHVVEIAFKNKGEDGCEETGWHYRDQTDPDFPDKWLHNGEESLKTSQAALDAFIANVTD